jgi:predicted GNAT family acetyltransferase
MRVERFTDIGAFAARIEPYLLTHEATHCLMLGLLSTLPREPMAAAEIPYMALVGEQGEVVLVAMRTPPFNVILSLIAPELASVAATEALELIASDLWSRYHETLPGVNAPVPVARLFAERWQERTGRAARLIFHERVYALERVIPAAGVSGAYRRVTEADRDLLIRWIAEFSAEALGPIERIDAAEWVDNFYATPSRGGYLWEDGATVTWVGYGSPTPHGVRIGPVYTPPKHRGHGYASACVAALSQHLLESGRTFCFLFTDLANPTANHIYQAVGYNPVNDVDVYEFERER